MALPRVIATDLDGTLLGRTGEVSERNRRALNTAIEAGIRVVIATGRPPRTTEAIASLFDCAAVVCGNGAHTRQPDRDPLVRAIDREISVTLMEKLRSSLPEAGFGVETGTGFYHDAAYYLEPWVRPGWVTGTLDHADPLLAVTDPITKLLVRSRDTPVHLMHEAAVASVGSLAEVTYSGVSGLLELSAPGVNKGSALALLCQEWGVSRDEVVMFGDMPNDLAALTWAGTGYVMENAHPELLAPDLGLRVAPPGSEDGVGRVVEELLARH